jgi:hypothetical protein
LGQIISRNKTPLTLAFLGGLAVACGAIAVEAHGIASDTPPNSSPTPEHSGISSPTHTPLPTMIEKLTQTPIATAIVSEQPTLRPTNDLVLTVTPADLKPTKTPIPETQTPTITSTATSTSTETGTPVSTMTATVTKTKYPMPTPDGFFCNPLEKKDIKGGNSQVIYDFRQIIAGLEATEANPLKAYILNPIPLYGSTKDPYPLRIEYSQTNHTCRILFANNDDFKKNGERFGLTSPKIEACKIVALEPFLSESYQGPDREAYWFFQPGDTYRFLSFNPKGCEWLQKKKE